MAATTAIPGDVIDSTTERLQESIAQEQADNITEDEFAVMQTVRYILEYSTAISLLLSTSVYAVIVLSTSTLRWRMTNWLTLHACVVLTIHRLMVCVTAQLYRNNLITATGCKIEQFLLPVQEKMIFLALLLVAAERVAHVLRPYCSRGQPPPTRNRSAVPSCIITTTLILSTWIIPFITFIILVFHIMQPEPFQVFPDNICIIKFTMAHLWMQYITNALLLVLLLVCTLVLMLHRCGPVVCRRAVGKATPTNHVICGSTLFVVTAGVYCVMFPPPSVSLASSYDPVVYEVIHSARTIAMALQPVIWIALDSTVRARLRDICTSTRHKLLSISRNALPRDEVPLVVHA